MQRLGKLERVNPRKIWADEARDFTPWLRESIRALSDALGIDIEITESEGSVGNFAVDLVGKDLGSGRPVVIENQLGSTDHDHLGKLLTYASGRDSRVAIWVATEFRDEHRQTLDWLNTISNGDRLFFGVQIEVLKIGNSLPAPNFDVVVAPTTWAPRELSPRQMAYQQFFTELLGKVKREIPGLTSASKGLPQNWLSFGAGRTGFSFAVSFAQKNMFRVEVYISGRSRSAFEYLREQREEIERDMGESLSWEEMAKDRRIAVYREGSVDDSDNREQLGDWAVEMLKRFNTVFRPRILKLPSNLGTAEDNTQVEKQEGN